jgi:hypothetical protein
LNSRDFGVFFAATMIFRHWKNLKSAITFDPSGAETHISAFWRGLEPKNSKII